MRKSHLDDVHEPPELETAQLRPQLHGKTAITPGATQRGNKARRGSTEAPPTRKGGGGIGTKATVKSGPYVETLVAAPPMHDAPHMPQPDEPSTTIGMPAAQQLPAQNAPPPSIPTSTATNAAASEKTGTFTEFLGTLTDRASHALFPSLAGSHLPTLEEEGADEEAAADEGAAADKGAAADDVAVADEPDQTRTSSTSPDEPSPDVPHAALLARLTISEPEAYAPLRLSAPSTSTADELHA